MKSGLDVKTHILKTTIDMLERGYEAEAITIRKIAKVADVSIGLINYHFGSKEKLLLMAVDQVIDHVSKEEGILLLDLSLPPKERLRVFLFEMAKIVINYESLSRTMLKQELLSDNFSTPKHILKILKEIQPEATDENLKWLSIMVVAPLQYVFLKKTGFNAYMEIDMEITPAFIDNHLNAMGL